MLQAYSYGGTTGHAEADESISKMKAVKHRPLKIRFNADVASSMQWNFKPQQVDITVSLLSILAIAYTPWLDLHYIAYLGEVNYATQK